MFSDGLKTAFSIIIPPIILGYFGMIDIGVNISLGVILTHICDIPGVLKDRRNFMILSMLSTFIISYITRTFASHELFVFIGLPIITFTMSMLTVYGQRSTNLGMSVMLSFVMSLSTTNTHDFNPLENSLLILIGGIWYIIIALTISQFRPYKMAQQSLADCMTHIADYIIIKSKYYDTTIDTERITRQLLEEQIVIHEKQDLVRELVFNNKKLIKDTTVIGRSLVFIFSDLNDIFESINATHYEYDKLNERFGKDESFRQINRISNKIGNELHSIAYHINTGRKPKSKFDFAYELNKLKEQINLYDNPEDHLLLHNVYLNLKHIIQKIGFIHRFFYEDKVKEKKKNPYDHLNKFTATKSYDLKKLRDHLNLQSSIFRHALRLSIVITFGYSITFLVPYTEHSHWIILTILVIMKPGFSVTKRRNYQRLLGTVFGGFIGIFVVYFIESTEIKFAIMLTLMIFAYTYLRHKYVIGTLFLTAYILISFSFLTQYNTFEVIGERLTDTLIGGTLAFVSSYIIFPSWESKNIKQSIQKTLIANYDFLYYIFHYVIYRDVNMTSYKLARKSVYVNMASVTSIFQRVISEPKKTQINAKELNRFTIFNHSFVSYSLGLLQLMQRKKDLTVRLEHVDLMIKILQQLHSVILIYGDFKPKHHHKDLMKDFQTPILFEETELNPDLITEVLELLEEIVYDLRKVSTKLN